jgi:hypothetical protein
VNGVFNNKSKDNIGRDGGSKGRNMMKIETMPDNLQPLISFVNEETSKSTIPDNYWAKVAYTTMQKLLKNAITDDMQAYLLGHVSMTVEKTNIMTRNPSLTEHQITHRDNNDFAVVTIMPFTNDYTLHLVTGSHKTNVDTIPLSSLEVRTIPKDAVFIMYSMLIHGGSKARPNLRQGEKSEPKHAPLQKYRFKEAHDISIHQYMSYPHTTSQTSGRNFPYVSVTNERSLYEPEVGAFSKEDHEYLNKIHEKHMTKMQLNTCSYKQVMKHQDEPRINDAVKLLVKQHPNEYQPETELKLLFASMKSGISPDGVTKIIKKRKRMIKK